MPKRFLKISKRCKKSPRAYWTKFQTASEMAAITPAVAGASSSEFLTNTARLYRLPSGRRKKPMSLIPMICPCALQSPVPVLCPMTAFPEQSGFFRILITGRRVICFFQKHSEIILKNYSVLLNGGYVIPSHILSGTVSGF